ncbi:MAG: hypothetical protein HC927_04585 [Deltaproteobacteria bacterium]|nr:hypothetical protein [Deltaproteobacteria bacterium]
MDVEVRYADAGQVLATCGSLMMRIVDGGRTELVDVDRALALFDELAETVDHVGVLIVVHHDSPTPPLPVLRYMASSGARLYQRGVMVCVVLGLGFWAMTAQRSLMILASFAGTRVLIESNLEAAAERLAGTVPGLEPNTVLRAYEAAASRFG